MEEGGVLSGPSLSRAVSLGHHADPMWMGYLTFSNIYEPLLTCSLPSPLTKGTGTENSHICHHRYSNPKIWRFSTGCSQCESSMELDKPQKNNAENIKLSRMWFTCPRFNIATVLHHAIVLNNDITLISTVSTCSKTQVRFIESVPLG